MDKLKKLLSLCKCGVYLTVNKHRDYYLTAQKELDDMENRVTVNIDKIIKAKMIETNTIVEVVFYPHTPVGSYIIYHWDIDGALDGALSVFEEQTDA